MSSRSGGESIWSHGLFCMPFGYHHHHCCLLAGGKPRYLAGLSGGVGGGAGDGGGGAKTPSRLSTNFPPTEQRRSSRPGRVHLLDERVGVAEHPEVMLVSMAASSALLTSATVNVDLHLVGRLEQAAQQTPARRSRDVLDGGDDDAVSAELWRCPAIEQARDALPEGDLFAEPERGFGVSLERAQAGGHRRQRRRRWGRHAAPGWAAR